MTEAFEKTSKAAISFNIRDLKILFLFRVCFEECFDNKCYSKPIES